MKKIQLVLDELQVESFDTTPVEEKQSEGTVMGYIPTFNDPTCPAAISCGFSCDNNTCIGSCGCPTFEISCLPCVPGD